MQTMAPWIAVGIATVALMVALIALFDRSGGVESPVPMSSPWSSAAPAAGGQPPDLSSMTPREAADRLFNRVMAASENGNSAEALRFTPMALQAYEALPGLDNDARYHVALLHLTAGDLKKARTLVDSMRKSAPHHLLAYMLEHQMAEQGGKRDTAAQIAKAFLAAYDAEMSAGRPEYQDHQNSIESFRKAAQAGAAVGK